MSENVGEPLAGHIALVTGAGRNIGRAIAEALAHAGAAVAVNGHRDIESLKVVTEGIVHRGGRGFAAMGDVSQSADVDRMISETEAQLRSIDILVSNVAMRPMRALLEITDDEWDRVLHTNLNASFYLARRILPGMV